MAYASASQSGYGSGPSVIHIDAAHPDVVSISDAELLFTGHLERKGPDLLLTGHDGRHHIIPGYFSAEHNADLVAPNGARITGDLINLLAGSAAPGQYAQTPAPVPTDAIGRIEKVVGNVTVMRNGVAVALHVGDAVYKNDVVQTGADSSAGIGFADGTALNLVANTRMALNDYVYDPNGSSNVALFNLVQGGFAFVAGKVAHTGDMKIGTPVATMGIRGTTGYALEQVATVNANAGNVTMSFAVVADPGSDRIGQYDLIDQFGNVVAQIGRAGIWTNVQFQGANLSPNISYTQMTASNFAVEQALVPALVQILNSINTQNLNPTPQSGPNSPGSSTPPIFELINLPQTLQQNSGTSLPISVPVNGANGPTTASGTVNINATPGPQATATVTWFSSFNGTWETATNWSDFSAPGAAQFVDIKRAVKVTIDAAEAVSGLLIGTGATLNIISGGALELLSGIANFGTLQINSSGSDPTLAINGTVYLLSSGTIALIGPTNENRIVGVGGTGATLVNVNNTIIGSGTIGQGDSALTLVNGSSGTIEATPLVAGDSGLLIISTGNPVSNSGLMTAAAGGTLHIFDSVTNFGLIQATASGTIIAAGNIDNFGEIEASGSGAQVSLTGGLTNESGATVVALSGGTITLAGIITNFGTIGANGAGAIVDLEGAHVSGGTLETRSGGIIETLSGTSTFSDVILARGSFITDADTVLRLEGSTALGGTVRFEGTGTFKLEGAGAEITGESNTRVELDNFSTINGEGKIGAGDRHFLLDNEGSGVIDATGQRALIIDNNSPGSAGTQPGNAVINTGLIEASGVGGLTIENTTISNATNAAHDTGHIRVFAESQITLDNATILHGVVSIAARGEMLTAKGTSDAIETADGQDNLSTFTLRNHGTLLVSDNSSLTLASPDAIYNSGTIKLDSSGHATGLYFDQQDAGINGGGQIVLSDNADNVIGVTQSGDQLTNFDNTISGAGTIGTVDAVGMVLVNDGIIDADHHNAALTLDPTFLANTGTLEATKEATLVFNDTTVSNSSATTATGATYSFSTLADPAAQGGAISASGINDAGQVVGTYYVNDALYGFVDREGTYTSLSDPEGVYSTVANGINDAGQIVGHYYDADGVAHGFLDGNGKYTTLNDPSGANGTYANGINDAGQIVGTYYDANYNPHGFLDSNGTYFTLSDPLGANGTAADGINNSGQIVGYYADASFRVHGFLYSNGAYITLTDPLAGTRAFQGTYAEGINDYGQIVGYYVDSNYIAHGFLYSNGVYTTLNDALGVDGTVANDINDVGQVTGSYYDGSFDQNSFVADPNESPSFGNVTAHRGTTIDLASSTIIDGTVHIAGVLDSTGTSVIVDAKIRNTGTIESTGGGTLTINSGTLHNAGALKVTHASTLDVSADVGGKGKVVIKGGGTADFTGAFNEHVKFAGAGTLALSDPADFHAHITGLLDGDTIDLSSIAPCDIASVTIDRGVGTSTLVVNETDGTTLDFTIAGNLAQSEFLTSADGSGGTDLVLTRITPVSWLSPDDGNWVDSARWSPAKVPTGDDAVTIGPFSGSEHPNHRFTVDIGSDLKSRHSPYSLTLDDNHATINDQGSLTLQGGMSIVAGTFELAGGTLRVAGSITLDASGRFDVTDNSTITGTTFSAAGRTLTVDGGDTLMLNAVTIDGGRIDGTPASGDVFASTIDFTGNSSISDAVLKHGDVMVASGVTLTLDGDKVKRVTVNDASAGTIDVTSDSTMSDAVLKHGHVMVASGVTLMFDRDTAKHVTFNDASTGTIDVTSDSTISDAVLKDGDATVAAGATLFIEGAGTQTTFDHVAVQNSGMIQVDAGTPVDLILADGTTLTGGTLSIGQFGGVEVERGSHGSGARIDSGITMTSGSMVQIDADATLAVHGAVAGAGSFTIDSGATLKLGNTVASGTNISFTGTTGDLKLDAPAGADLNISGFTGTAPDAGHSDEVQLAGVWSIQSETTTSGGNVALDLQSGPETVTLWFESPGGTLKVSNNGTNTHIFDPLATPVGAFVSPDNDTFVFHSGMGAETISNFNPQADTIELDNFNNIHSVHQLASLITTDAQGDAVIGLGHHDSITLPGVSANYLQAHLHSLAHLG